MLKEFLESVHMLNYLFAVKCIAKRNAHQYTVKFRWWTLQGHITWSANWIHTSEGLAL